jgi:chorismate mutase
MLTTTNLLRTSIHSHPSQCWRPRPIHLWSRRLPMLIRRGEVAILILLVIAGITRASTPSAIDKLQPLVETTARRLAIAEQIALSKWDTQLPVEDAPREEQVIVSVIKEGQSRGLDKSFVSNFFRAQIEANKLVQYSLLAHWRREGTAPDHAPINLVATIRPELDALEIKLIAQLAETKIIRASTSCHADIAKAVGKYTTANKTSPLMAIALDRALASACQ